jgi:hypothetical protein
MFFAGKTAVGRGLDPVRPTTAPFAADRPVPVRTGSGGAAILSP